MRQLSSRQTSDTLQQRLILSVKVISIGVLLALTSCAPGANNADRVNQTGRNDSQVQSNSDQTSESPSGTVDTPADMTVDPESTNILDNDLLIKAAQDNLFELQAGQLAMQKASTAEVKQFAQKMVQDHTKATDLLRQLAAERNITLPTEMGQQNQAVFARLPDLSGTEFDRAYMTEMVNSHQKDVALARNQVQNGKDQELKALAAEKLPDLEGHLRMAQDLAQQLSS